MIPFLYENVYQKLFGPKLFNAKHIIAIFKIIKEQLYENTQLLQRGFLHIFLFYLNNRILYVYLLKCHCKFNISFVPIIYVTITKSK